MADQSAVAPPRVPAPPLLVGIGGWLVLVAIGQVLGPIRVVAGLALYYSASETGMAFRAFPVAMYGELLLNLLNLAIIGTTTCLFFARKRIFKLMFTIEVIAIPAVLILDYAWISVTTRLPLAQLFTTADLKSIAGFVIGLLWVAYIWNSERVRNTFVN